MDKKKDNELRDLILVLYREVENLCNDSVKECVNNILYNIETNNSLRLEEKVEYYVILIVLTFRVRNIRNNGKGLRDKFHIMYLTLLNRFLMVFN